MIDEETCESDAIVSVNNQREERILFSRSDRFRLALPKQTQANDNRIGLTSQRRQDELLFDRTNIHLISQPDKWSMEYGRRVSTRYEIFIFRLTLTRTSIFFSRIRLQNEISQFGVRCSFSARSMS